MACQNHAIAVCVYCLDCCAVVSAAAAVDTSIAAAAAAMPLLLLLPSSPLPTLLSMEMIKALSNPAAGRFHAVPHRVVCHVMHVFQELHHAKSLCDACCVVHHAHGRFAGDWLSGVTPWPGPRPDHARSTSARGARDAPRAGARSGSAVRKKGIVVICVNAGRT